jgi:hypothetical protein
LKLLIGYDGSRFAGDALEDLRRAGLPQQGEALALCVADVWLPSSEETDDSTQQTMEWLRSMIERSRAAARQAVQEAQALAEQAAARLRTWLPNWNIQASAR